VVRALAICSESAPSRADSGNVTSSNTPARPVVASTVSLCSTARARSTAAPSDSSSPASARAASTAASSSDRATFPPPMALATALASESPEPS
jgi:hypothetical protein